MTNISEKVDSVLWHISIRHHDWPRTRSINRSTPHQGPGLPYPILFQFFSIQGGTRALRKAITAPTLRMMIMAGSTLGRNPLPCNWSLCNQGSGAEVIERAGFHINQFPNSEQRLHPIVSNAASFTRSNGFGATRSAGQDPLAARQTAVRLT